MKHKKYVKKQIFLFLKRYTNYDQNWKENEQSARLAGVFGKGLNNIDKDISHGSN